MPDACGDINPIRSCEDTGNELANVICQKLEARVPIKTLPVLGVKKQTITEGKTEIDAVVHSWHVGDVAFSSIPGELFVEWGIRIKEKSSFPWRYPVELSEGSLGYLITQDAWEHGAYEALTSKTAFVSVEGVQSIVNQTVKDLNLLRKTMLSEKLFPKIEKLKNGGELTIRPLKTNDGEALAGRAIHPNFPEILGIAWTPAVNHFSERLGIDWRQISAHLTRRKYKPLRSFNETETPRPPP